MNTPAIFVCDIIVTVHSHLILFQNLSESWWSTMNIPKQEFVSMFNVYFGI